jgi:hypothetical protein
MHFAQDPIRVGDQINELSRSSHHQISLALDTAFANIRSADSNRRVHLCGVV